MKIAKFVLPVFLIFQILTVFSCDKNTKGLEDERSTPTTTIETFLTLLPACDFQEMALFCTPAGSTDYWQTVLMIRDMYDDYLSDLVFRTAETKCRSLEILSETEDEVVADLHLYFCYTGPLFEDDSVTTYEFEDFLVPALRFYRVDDVWYLDAGVFFETFLQSFVEYIVGQI